MSVVRGYPNAGHFYSNIVGPVKIDLNFIVDSTNGNGLGIRSLKSNGYVNKVFMNSSVPPSGSPALGTARTYAILGASTVTNTGASALTGNLGLTPGTSITGFPPGTFTGVENIANAAAAAAKASALSSYNTLVAHTPYTIIPSALDGQTLTAGYYNFTSGAATLAASAPGTLTLNGSATDIFVIKTASTLTTGAGGAPTVALTGGAKASNVYWVIGSSATLNSGTAGTFNGNAIANTSITVTSGGTINGSLVALNGAVTLSAATNVNVAPLASSALSGNPNPLPGYVLVQFNNNFNKYLGGFAGYVSPLSGTNVAVNSTNLVLGQAYVISSVGTSTLANWQALGLPAGLTPAVGQSFIAIATGAGSGTGQVQVPLVSGVNSVEVIGDPNLEIANSNISLNGGAYLLLQFLFDGVLAAPADGTVVGLSAFFDNSSVTVDGL